MEREGCFNLTAIVTFFVVWGVCISEAGVMGFMLGWMAALIAAVLVGFVVFAALEFAASLLKDIGCRNLLLAWASVAAIFVVYAVLQAF